MSPTTETTGCCIAGGGPAGMMLGYLLARAGVRVMVLEKHADFLRDFRGDTIHPSTLEILHELGLLQKFLSLPHQEAELLDAQVGDFKTHAVDFSHLPTHCRFIAFMPQWDFLDFLAREAKAYPNFTLRQRTEATDLIEEGGTIRGLRAKTSEGAIDIRADLVVGADGRHSLVREKTRLPLDDIGAPMDVLWFRLSRQPGDGSAVFGRFDTGRVFIMINRGEYWQCGYVIAKGSFDTIRARGLQAFRSSLAELLPFSAERLAELADWDPIKLLTVGVTRMPRWYRPGVLCIGDAAHTMSPVGGVGINLAIQDAVAAANRLAEPLRQGCVDEGHLRHVQERRIFAVRTLQWLQVAIQNRVIAPVLGGGPIKPPLALRLLARFPVLRRVPARVIGLGIRPEHVRIAPQTRA